MNLNKALIITCGILGLLVVVTVINLNRSKSAPLAVYNYTDDEALLMNMHCIPEIVNSYERVKDVYGKKNTLFFRFTNNTCSSCLVSQLNEVLTLQEEIGKERVLIFSAYPDDRNSKIQMNAELAKYNYRNIPVDSLLIPTYQGEQKSYFGWMNSDGEIEMVFVPDKSNVRLTRLYFLEVKKKINMLADN